MRANLNHLKAIEERCTGLEEELPLLEAKFGELRDAAEAMYEKRAKSERKRQLRIENIRRGHCVIVFAAIRPPNRQSSAGSNKPSSLWWNKASNQIVVRGTGESQREETFTLDRIFEPGFAISDVKNALDEYDWMEQLLSGDSFVVMAHGYTSSGKTRLMLKGGEREDSEQNQALVLQMLTQLFDSLPDLAGWNLSMQAIQILDDKMQDLLSQVASKNKGTASLPLVEVKDGYFTIKDGPGVQHITSIDLRSVKDVRDYLSTICTRRKTEDTPGNPSGSSRSHAILIFRLRIRQPSRLEVGGFDESEMHLAFFDLTGNESIEILDTPELRKQRKGLSLELSALKTAMLQLREKKVGECADIPITAIFRTGKVRGTASDPSWLASSHFEPFANPASFAKHLDRCCVLRGVRVPASCTWECSQKMRKPDASKRRLAQFKRYVRA